MNIEQQIYTSCPQGKGYDGISGFQVKARSSGITDSMSRAILRYSNHYRVPRELRQQEYQYYQAGKDMPQEFLSEFPVVITYHHVEADIYGLTRIRYLGKDYSGRPGNFYAHTLVFNPAALRQFDYNPIALLRADIFQRRLDDDKTVIDPIKDFDCFVPKHSEQNQNWMAKVSDPAYEASYLQILGALNQKLYLQRPIILLFKEQTESIQFIESLLLLLPSATRCRTTFTTYEPDPYTLIKRDGGEQLQNNLHIITTIRPESGGTLEFRAHELAQFLIWDFSGAHSSEFPQPTIYSQYMIKLCQNNQLNIIKQIHNFLTQIGAGQQPDTWDALIQAERLEGIWDSAEASQLTPIVTDTLLRVAKNESQLEQALKIILPLLQKATFGPGVELFSPLHGAFSQLLGRLPSSYPYRLRIRNELIEMITKLLQQANVERANLIAELEQNLIPSLLVQGINRIASDGWPELNLQTPLSDFVQNLNILEALSHIPDTHQWVAQTLWRNIKLLAEANSNDDYFDQMVDKLIPIIERTSPEGNTRDEIIKESKLYTKMLLKKGFPHRSQKILKLSGLPVDDIMPQIYDELIRELWLTDQPQYFSSRPEDRDALMMLINPVLEKIFKKVPEQISLDGLIPAYRAASLCGNVDQLWINYKKPIFEILSKQPEQSVAIRFIETIANLLSPLNFPEDKLKLYLQHTSLKPPVSEDEWVARLVILLQEAVNTSDTDQNISITLNLIKDSLKPYEQINVLAAIPRKIDLSPKDCQSVIKNISKSLCDLSDDQIFLPDKNRINLDMFAHIFKTSHSIRIADRLWDHLKQKNILKILLQSRDNQSLLFINDLINMLDRYNCSDDVLDLFLKQTGLSRPDTFEDWKKKCNEFVNFLVKAESNIEEKIDYFLKLLSTPLSFEKQAIVLDILFQGGYNISEIGSVISQKYFNLLKSQKDQIWEIRLSLANENLTTRSLLVNDFIHEVISYIQKVKIVFEAWSNRIFSRYPGMIGVISNAIANRINHKTDISNELQVCEQIIDFFGEKFLKQYRPLLKAYVRNAPLDDTYKMWKPWFDRLIEDGEEFGLESKLFRLFALVKRIEKNKADNKLDTHLILEHLKKWRKLVTDLDQTTTSWAEERIILLLGEVDISSAGQFMTVVNNSLARYHQQNLRTAVEYVIDRFPGDKVGLMLQVIVFGQAGLKDVVKPEGKMYADITSKILDIFPTAMRSIFWQLLLKRSQQMKLPTSNAFQQFQRMTGTVARLGRASMRILKKIWNPQDAKKSKKSSKRGKQR